MNNARPFPIPLVASIGPGSQPEDESPNVLPMPRDMAVYQPPALPEPEELASHQDALSVLQAARENLLHALAGEDVAPLDLMQLSDEGRALVNQVLGEGEVAVQVKPPATGGPSIQAQESVFAGVWRVLQLQDGTVQRDTLEVGAMPRAVLEAARQASQGPQPVGEFPPGVMNGPSLYEELCDRQRRWQPGTPAHVVNLTLLPLTAEDSLWLEERLAPGRVMILSRGYGNCRVVDTRLHRTWRVTYFNAQDLIILDTLEVGSVPEVACAAREDLEDSAERLGEVLQWVEQA